MSVTYHHWRLQQDHDSILWLMLDRQDAAINTLNAAVLQEFDAVLDQVIADHSIKGMVIYSGKKNGFIAGADISEFQQIATEEQAIDLVRHVHRIFAKLAALTIPTVAMINGFCLGGGLELALACTYRVASLDDKTKISFPEVKLGLQPGWGGSVRSVRLIGPFKALNMMLSGQMLDARTAMQLGWVDVAVPARILERAARDYVLQKPKRQQPGLFARLANISALRPLLAKIIYRQLRQKKIKKTHYPAPFAMVDHWLRDGAKGEKAFIDEAKSISRLMMTDSSRNLVRDFFLQTRLKGFARKPSQPCQRVHVIGAGTMGGDIAAWCAYQGLNVTLQDQKPEFIAKAIARAYQLFQKKYKKNKSGLRAAMDRLMADDKGYGVRSADLVIEAISENLNIKQNLYKALEPQLQPHAILATNTSSLPLDDLNQVLKNPERLVGIHFFNPVALMQLVEVVRGDKTSEACFQQALAFVGKINRLPLAVKSSPGFLVNRVLMPYLLEAVNLLQEGVAGSVIDQAAVEFGMPMGPIELADTVGLDVCLSVAEILVKQLGGDVPEPLREMVAKNYLGRKTNQGFYQYRGGKKLALPTNPESNLPENITDRLILRMLNEAVACLREGIVTEGDLIDAGMIFGTGFAPFRGGPIHYIETEGKENIVRRLNQLEQQCGKRFKADEYFY